MLNKKWYKSKTLWVNSIAICVIAVQYMAGVELIPAELQTAILAGLNVILRSITKENLIIK